MDAETWREAARQLREEAAGICAYCDDPDCAATVLLGLARRFEAEAKAEKAANASRRSKRS